MSHQIFLIFAICAVLIHIAEEFKFGWIEWANSFISGITVKQFAIINILFLILCFTAIFINNNSMIFSASIFSLLLINSLVHIAPTIKQKKYSPGLYSAVILFIPIGTFGYIHVVTNNLVTFNELIYSILLGICWMSIPFIFQIIRIMIEKSYNKTL